MFFTRAVNIITMRESWDTIFIQMANLVAKRSSCIRMQVGAVLVKDNRVISIGVNGTPRGVEHCCDKFHGADVTSQEFKDLHREFSRLNEVHAEVNALMFAAKNGMSPEGCSIYVSYAPCIDCAKQILAAGIKKVYFATPYDRTMEGRDFLVRNGIPCEQLPVNL